MIRPALAIDIAVRAHTDYCTGDGGCFGALTCGLVEIDGMTQEDIEAAARQPALVADNK